MKTSIRRIVFGLVVAGAVLMSIPSSKWKPEVLAQSRGCSLRSLDSTYGFSFAGYVGSATPYTPVAAAGTIAFEPDGTLTRNFNFSFGGTIIAGLNDSASYSLNSDCTFSTTLPSGEMWNLIPVDNGKQIEFFVNASGTVGAGTLTRQ